MKTKNKPRYGLWRNTGFMVGLAWKECKSVLVITLALALTMTAKSVVQLLVNRYTYSGEVEAAAPVPELLLTIAIFSGALFLVSGLEALSRPEYPLWENPAAYAAHSQSRRKDGRNRLPQHVGH